VRFLVRRRLDGSPCVPYGAVLEVRPKGQRYLGAGASSHYAACMHACSCALERLPIRTVRHTVASHDLATYRLVRSGQHARGQRGAGTIVATA